jgi:hypothetical protein
VTSHVRRFAVRAPERLFELCETSSKELGGTNRNEAERFQNRFFSVTCNTTIAKFGLRAVSPHRRNLAQRRATFLFFRDSRSGRTLTVGLDLRRRGKLTTLHRARPAGQVHATRRRQLAEMSAVQRSDPVKDLCNDLQRNAAFLKVTARVGPIAGRWLLSPPPWE